MADARSGLTALKDKVLGLLDSHKSIRRVADDPVLTAELLLLMRMSIADRKVMQEEADAFAAIATRVLGLDGGELKEILAWLHDFGYETSSQQAAEMLTDLPAERRQEILDHMRAVAIADGELDERERRMLDATADRLGLPRVTSKG